VYEDETIKGFMGTHQPAVWMGESGQVAVAVGTGEVRTSFEERGLSFSHEDEISSPHYYSTKLNTDEGSSIVAELTGTSRAGSMRFTFDPKSTPFAVVQATTESVSGQITVDPEQREVYGWNPERQDSVLGPFSAADFKGYFVARFEEDFESWGTANNSTLFEGATYGEGLELSAYVRFPPGIEKVHVRVGVSYISVEQARINLNSEIPDGTSLDDTASYVRQKWSDKLDLVSITNATEDELAIFYTAMFHALQYPNEMMEYNASGSFYYSGYDNTVHAGEHAYTGYSIWDTFRAEWGFLNLFAPERIDGMIQSMLQTFQQGGRLPMWQNIVETNIMIGTHSSSLIAESLAKGFRGFDQDLAWKAVLKDAMVPPEDDLTTMYFDRQRGTGCEARAGLTRELELGYVAALLTSEAGSRTLEYAYDDYTVAVIAELTGHTEHKQYFLDRSKNYRNIFNNETMFMEARHKDGSWCPNPSTWTEGNKWVYTFNVQHDFPGLRDLFHGPEALGAKLDEYYNGHHNNQANEPSHATVYAYLYANQPWKAQSTIRNLIRNNYYNTPIGLSGNDDCGQMSSWYMFNALGLYPVNPASAEYMIGSPIFDKVEVRFPQTDHTLTIAASGARDKPYVKSLTMDEVAIDTPVIHHEELLQARTLSYEMSDEPQLWGSNKL